MELPHLTLVESDRSFDYCFGCGELNPIGLHLRPHYDGDRVTATFTPTLDYQGWHNVTHGGILYSILDEVTAYVVLCSGFSFGVTAKSTIRFKQVAPTGQRLVASAWATKVTSRLIEVRGELELEGRDMVAEVESAFIPGDRCKKAFLWDMDGVIVDSAGPHYQSWRETLGARGADYSEAQFTELFGTRDDYIITQVLGPLPHKEVDEIARQKEERYRQLIRGQVQVFPGVERLLKAMKKGGYRVALGTSAPMENVEAVTAELSLRDYFDVIVCGEDVTEGKPSPMIYLHAARKLGVEPGDCVVFEDSPHGVDAARRGGMKCVAVTSTHPAEALQAANRVVGSMEEIDLIQLIRWI